MKALMEWVSLCWMTVGLEEVVLILSLPQDDPKSFQRHEGVLLSTLHQEVPPVRKRE